MLRRKTPIDHDSMNILEAADLPELWLISRDDQESRESFSAAAWTVKAHLRGTKERRAPPSDRPASPPREESHGGEGGRGLAPAPAQGARRDMKALAFWLWGRAQALALLFGVALIHAAIFRCEPWREWLDIIGGLVMSMIALFVGYGVVRAYLEMGRRQGAELDSRE